MPIQWPGKITLPMSGAADPDDFAKRWEETFKSAPAITDPAELYSCTGHGCTEKAIHKVRTGLDLSDVPHFVCNRHRDELIEHARRYARVSVCEPIIPIPDPPRR